MTRPDWATMSPREARQAFREGRYDVTVPKIVVRLCSEGAPPFPVVQRVRSRTGPRGCSRR